MLFNSYIFILVFLPLTIILYYLSRKFYGRELSFVVLVAASFFYYGYWKASYLIILFFSIIFNYYIGIYLSKIHKTKYKKRILTLSITLNLLLLGYYKYTNFFLDNLSFLLGNEYSTLAIILPIGISFFTFQQIAYLVDAYRGEAKEYSFVHYCLFITFFPQLIAGPIVHHKQMLPQFMDKTKALFNAPQIWQGMVQFTIGLFKKVILADMVALYSTPVFSAADNGLALSTGDAWVGILAYAFQLYFDFSAYSDMALGIGKMFGIKLPVNFNSPYKSRSIVEFWRRWHITLSTFLKDYLYIALGGNRHGNLRRYINLILTMFLGGLWHGASWNFALWGLLHGLFLMINHAWSSIMPRRITANFAVTCFSYFLTFMAVIHAWVLFRAETLDGALRIFSTAYQSTTDTFFVVTSEPVRALMALGICAIIAFFMPNTQEFTDRLDDHLNAKTPITTPWYISLTNHKVMINLMASGFIVLCLSSMNKVSEFLYFQF